MATWILFAQTKREKNKLDIAFANCQCCEVCPFCYPRPRLQDEGSNFQRVLEEARHQLARHYLNNSVLELNEAAYLLGYEDGNSFVRAFRTWEGVPPARWRENNRPRAAS